MKPTLAITMGDPGGVGPEIILKALAGPEVPALCVPLVVGDLKVLEAAKSFTPGAEGLTLVSVSSPEEAKDGAANVLDMGMVRPGELTLGQPGAYAGRAVVEYIKKAVGLAMQRRVAGVVTAPINKETLKMAGHPWPGHTELLAELTGTRDYGMMLVGGGLRVMLVTIHKALRDVPGLVTGDSVLRAIRLAARACDMLGLPVARIVVAGLNPHAGEGGLFGDEEARHIVPACEAARALGLDVTGPLPPDTLFYKARRGDFDIVVAMYHDQGLIPLKMLAFGSAVNVTVGLPITRTSVDHGTAYDISGKGIAEPASLVEAVRLAARAGGRG